MVSTFDTKSISTIYLLRHGDRYDKLDGEWKEKVTKNGGLYIDPPLSGVGHEQARETAAMLKDVKVDTILVSPYLRTIQTAVPFAEQLGLHICLEHGLAECRHVPGLLPNASSRYNYYPYIDTEYNSMMIPLASKEVFNTDYNKAQESWPEGYFKRIKTFADILTEKGFGKTIFCISHAASVALVAALLKCKLEDIPADDNCKGNKRTDLFALVGMYKLIRKGSGQWKLIFNGSTNKHLSQPDGNTKEWGYNENYRQIWQEML